MATWDNLISRIADDLDRSDLNTQIGVAINRAIQHYAAEVFWFNEATGTLTTAASTQTYTTSGGLPSLMREIEHVRLYNGSGSYTTLCRRTMKWLLETNVSGTTTTGEPTDYAWHNETLYLYPTPDAAYAMTLYYTEGYADLSAGGSNSFTDNAEDLIEARATWWVQARILKDYQAAAVSKAEEREALSYLRERSERLLTTGKLGRAYL